jgi:hypothetical protein
VLADKIQQFHREVFHVGQQEGARTGALRQYLLR